MTATLRTDFDAFLFASVGDDANGMPLTVVTLLARLGVDPWQEATDLAHLSIEAARERLGARLEAASRAPATEAETATVVKRLVALLHRVPARKSSAPQVPLQKNEAPVAAGLMKRSKGIPVAIYWALGLILVLLIDWTISTRQAQAPMDTTIFPDSRK